jgi:calcium-dependent protein kinase
MPPFNGASDQEIMKKVRAGKFAFSDASWSNVSDKGKDFITKLLTFNADARPSAEEMLKHAWVTDTIAVDSANVQGALGNLKAFSADQKLKQATYTYIATQLLSKEEKANLAKVFKAMDINGDGKLSKEEVVEGYEKHFGKTLS